MMKSGKSPDAIPRSGDVFATVLESVTAAIGRATGSTANPGDTPMHVMTEVIQDGVHGAVAAGSDLAPASKAILLGVLRSTAEQGEAALRTIASVAAIIIHRTADRGGNLSAATKGLVLGAIAGAKAIGSDPAGAASMAAKGALEGAAQAGSVTVERVLAALKEPIGGMKIALPAPPPRSGER